MDDWRGQGIALLINRASVLENIAEVFRWGSSDAQWARQFPGEFLGGRPAAAAVGKFNPGQKAHVFATFLLVVGLGATGTIMWLAHQELFPQWLVELSFRLHELLTFAYLPMLAGHIYLTVGHPVTRESTKGMIGGRVSSSYAALHHRAWHEKAFCAAAEKVEPARTASNVGQKQSGE